MLINSIRSILLKNKFDEVKKRARANGLNEEEIEFTFNEALHYITQLEKKEKPFFIQKIKFKWLILIIAMCLGVYFHKPTHSLIVRNYQEMIYPFMTLHRIVTLPLIKKFPFLTELYDESCLVENPYFAVKDMECWPCENVRFVLNITENNHPPYHTGVPLIIKVPHSIVTLPDIKNVFLDNKNIFITHASRVYDNIKDTFIDVNNFFKLPIKEKDHYTWKINRMEPGRVLRALTKPPRDELVPDYASAINVERFLLFDGPRTLPYNVPSTEGANVYIKQLYGQRLIVLDPSPECKIACKRLSFLLEPQHLVWFNWWYWRPRSLPVYSSTSISITLLGSSA